jgi:hypothetical protein
MAVLTMRLFDADKLDWWYKGRNIRRVIDDAPTVDAVIVTRCKDCKHLCVWNRKDIYAFCPKTNIVFLPFDKDTRTFFCSLGERKDGGDG